MKTLLTILLTIALTTQNANYHSPDKPELIYYSPQTCIRLDFTYTETIQEAGEFATYAEKMLGIKDAITANQTTYALLGVDISTRTYADLNRPHTIAAEKNMPWLLANINERGLLVGFNMPQPKKEQKHPVPQNEDKPRHTPVSTIPYSEELVEAKTIEAQAQAVAKQIFHIRETRMYLLSGEVEHAPADGEAMRLVLNELEKQETKLIEKFIGKTTIRKCHKYIANIPYGEDLKVWNETLYFSEDNGFTDADNVDAYKVNISAVFQHQLMQTPESAQKASKGKHTIEPSPIVYNLPGIADISVYYGDKLINKKTIPMAQFGADMPLPKELFTGKDLPVIVISEKTGNIISISK